MSVIKKIKELLKPKLKLLPGTRLTSFLFIAVSIAIAAGILFAANLYYDIDTSQIVVEEVQKATQVIKATAGLVVGADQTLPGGTVFLATSSNAVVLGGANQELRFTGGTSYYVGFKATTSLATTTTYIWPTNYPAGSGYVLSSDTGGAMSWTAAAAGTITAVGNVTSGAAFTGTQGSTLWFKSGSFTGALTIDTLSANATYTLPNISGTNYLTLTSGGLGTGGVLFADGGLIATSSNFTWATSTRTLTLGSNGTSGQLRIYDGSYYLGFTATSTMTTSTLYYWPTGYGQNLQVLTTDGSGQLSWQNVTGTGAVLVSGSPSAGQVTFWDSGTSITGDSYFTWSTSTHTLTLGNNGGLVASYVQTPLLKNTGSLTIQTDSGNIILDPNGDIVNLATSTYIQTQTGYEMGKTGTQILREMGPIMGFDLPAQTATTSYVPISRVIEDYPFSATSSGTNRVHKFVIRYADATTTASTTWRVYNVTDSTTTDTFTVPPTASTTLDQGEVYITGTVTIPTDTDDWRLDLYTPGTTIRVYQIFLAAYDEIQ